MQLQATFEHPLRDRYTRPGGPWDLPPLAELLGGREGGGVRLVDGPVVLDDRQLDAAIAALAGGLRRWGVGRGDVVAWQLPNWHEAVLLYRACWLIGAVAAPFLHRLGPADVAGLVERLEPALLLSAPGLALAATDAAVVVRGPADGFADLLSGPAGGPEPVRGDDIALAMSTSGSSGQPKVVLHTHRALGYKARVQRRAHGLGPDDVVLMPAPLSHVSGLVNAVLLPGVSGMKVVLMDTWDPERALDLIEHERVTFMGGPAVFATGLLDSPAFTPARVRSLRVCSLGGSTMTPAALAALADGLGCTVKRSYGSTEVPTVTTMHAGDPAVRGLETDGRPVGDAEVTVVDPATGAGRPPGEVGEVWLRAPEMFAGYLSAAETGEAVTPDGWLRTGDLGVQDAGGWLTIAGRIKELIIRGGENIAPAEVEAILEAHPSVGQAVAIGYPDRRLGERVAAVVVAGDGFDLEACRRWFTGRGVARFKTPEAVIHVGAIPMTATGKADRAGLRRMVTTVLAPGGS